MRIVATLQKPDEGSVHLDELDVLAEPERTREVLGYLPQDFGLYPRVSAEALLTHFAALEGIVGRLAKREVVSTLLRKTNLWDVRKARLGTFSGGMRQRFGVAVAMLGNPRLLVVDEPTAGLDPAERVRFLNMLSELGERSVVVLSTHIVEDVSDLCTRMGRDPDRPDSPRDRAAPGSASPRRTDLAPRRDAVGARGVEQGRGPHLDPPPGRKADSPRVRRRKARGRVRAGATRPQGRVLQLDLGEEPGGRCLKAATRGVHRQGAKTPRARRPTPSGEGVYASGPSVVQPEDLTTDPPLPSPANQNGHVKTGLGGRCGPVSDL